MRIQWNDQCVRWFHTASEYTQYNEKLAKILLEKIPEQSTVCDIGCGCGLVDLELAEYMKEITCVDTADVAIDGLKKDVAEAGIENITAICQDGETLSGTWDTVLTLFHGGEKNMEKYWSYAREQLIMGIYVEEKGSFGPKNRKKRKRFHAQDACKALDELGMTYTVSYHSLEYGQPLESFQDAKEFLRSYCQPMGEEELEAYLQGHLQMTGREDFPYYLPKKKKFALFVIRRDENDSK